MPDVCDPITLRIDGVDWTYWHSVEVTRQMDAIAGAFSLRLADRWVDGAQAVPLAAGMPCEVLIGGQKVICGYIDKVSPSFDANAHGISVSGRDKSGDMVDCVALHKPGQWQNVTVLQIAQELATPFGVTVTAEGDVWAPIPSFKLEQGEAAFEALDRALKLRELLACPDDDGGIVLIKTGSRINDAALTQGQNILRASATYDLTDRFSDYIVQGQQPGTDTRYGLEASAVQASTKDAAVKRYRPYMVRAEANVDTAAAKQRAAWECSVRAARSVTVSVTVQGFRQGQPGEKDAPLWQINALTDVDIPYLRLQQQLLVSKVIFRRDASGSTTTLELRDPKAFQPEPKTEGEKAQGKAKASPTTEGSGAYTIEAEKDLQSQCAAQAGAAQQKIAEGA